MMKTNWPEGRRCAVSLTYDDAFDSHWREVAPKLSERGFRGTFYTPIRASLWEHAAEWRKVAEAGHELGNHTVFHPCRRAPESENYGRFDRYDLSRYTLEELAQEVGVANAYLELLDGQSVRTYGNTCHNVTVGRGADEVSITPVLQRFFPAARGGRKSDFRASSLDGIDFYEVGCVSSHSSAELKLAVDHARECGGWLVICLHGVADKEERLQIARKEHDAVLEYLAADTSTWVASVRDVATWLNPKTVNANAEPGS